MSEKLPSFRAFREGDSRQSTLEYSLLQKAVRGVARGFWQKHLFKAAGDSLVCS